MNAVKRAIVFALAIVTLALLSPIMILLGAWEAASSTTMGE